jgi:D-arabinose 1-dehydrogenase-like Zn-dependent alcohol dehydrogenase
LARQLGAGHYIDSTAADPAAELQRLGGAKIIVATATSARAIAATIGGPSLDGRVVVLGADYTPVALNTTALIGKRTGPLRVAFRFIHRFGRHDEILGDERCAAMTETFPLEKTQEAYDRMMSNKARFRCVLTTGN